MHWISSINFGLLICMVNNAWAYKMMMHVIGGAEILPHSYPWMISVQYDNSHKCGASLLRSPCNDYGSDIILTAAHCVCGEFAADATKYTVKAGVHDLSKVETGVEVRLVFDIRCHEKFQYPPFYDIAILKLDKPIRFNSFIYPIDLPDITYRLDGSSSCKLIGWGWTQYEVKNNAVVRTLNNVLRELKLNPDSTFCQSSFPEFRDDLLICAERSVPNPDGTAGTGCFYDSGSPLICGEGDRYVLAGVDSGPPSHIEYCTIPEVFSRIASLNYWIKRQIKSIHMNC